MLRSQDFCYNGWPILNSSLETAAFIIKQDYPDIPIGMIHGPYEMFSFLHGDRSHLLNPSNIDWHSFDCYGDYNYCGGFAGMENFYYSIPDQLNALKSELRYGQTLFLVPDAFSAGVSDEGMITRANQYASLAESEPLVTGLFPFIC